MGLWVQSGQDDFGRQREDDICHKVGRNYSNNNDVWTKERFLYIPKNGFRKSSMTTSQTS